MSNMIVIRLTNAFLLVVAISVVALDLVVAQDPSSSAQQNANVSNANTTKPRRRSKHRAASPTRTAEANANMAAEQASETTTNMPAAKPRRHPGCDPSQPEQTDLSGTYNGGIDYPEGGLTGEATLTITGNNFTLTSGSTTQSGRITAVTTCGYTAATMMFGEVAMPKPGEQPAALPLTISLRARKKGEQLTLSSVSGEKHSFKFDPVGRPRHTRRRAATPAVPATPAEPATPAQLPAPAESATPAQPPTPGTMPEAGPAPAESTKPATPRRGKIRRRGSKKTMANSNSNTP
jgi:hypothetical protein